MKTVAVTGKNFGDEGKGLACHFLSRGAGRVLGVRHNGGSQSGHTVERKGPGGGRFVFHALSSGTFNGADTLWAQTFTPDLYKIGEEIEAFRAAAGFLPRIFAEEMTCVTVPDDVLINMALEASRGAGRHGSCGMGINECDLRNRAGFSLPLGALAGRSAREVYGKLRRIREEYVSVRLSEISPELTSAASSFTEMLSDDRVLRNAAETMADNLRFVTVLSEEELQKELAGTDLLLFEAGQGLLLDKDNRESAPHVTASSTGLANPLAFLRKRGLTLHEAVYVSRTYLTRHGAGPLPGECAREELGCLETDLTNTPNDWQGAIRYAAHPGAAEFVRAVREDVKKNGAESVPASLFLTHLDETGGCVMTEDGTVPAEVFLRLPEITETFSAVYRAGSRFAEDVRTETA